MQADIWLQKIHRCRQTSPDDGSRSPGVVGGEMGRGGADQAAVEATSLASSGMAEFIAARVGTPSSVHVRAWRR